MRRQLGDKPVPGCSTSHWGNQESHKPPLIRQSSRVRCHPSRNLQGWRASLSRKTDQPCPVSWNWTRKLEAFLIVFKDASLISLYKRKGNRLACENHRGISLLSIAGRILARIILNHLIVHQDQDLLTLPESQCGFRKDCGTTYVVFTAPKLQEKCQEQHADVYKALIDLTKAFDTAMRAYGRSWPSTGVQTSSSA